MVAIFLIALTSFSVPVAQGSLGQTSAAGNWSEQQRFDPAGRNNPEEARRNTRVEDTQSARAIAATRSLMKGCCTWVKANLMTSLSFAIAVAACLSACFVWKAARAAATANRASLAAQVVRMFALSDVWDARKELEKIAKKHPNDLGQLEKNHTDLIEAKKAIRKYSQPFL